MNDLKETDDEFYECIEKLKTKYNEKPKQTIRALKSTINTIEAQEPSNSVMEDLSKHKQIIIMISLCIIIALIGLLRIETYPQYLFGLIFFIAGFFIGMYIPIFGLIFLFSHGGTGLGIMIYSLLGESLTSPILQDSPKNIYIYLGIGVVLLIITVFSIILFNVSATYREKRFSAYIPLILIIMVLIMSAIFPNIMYTIYAL